MGHVIVEARTYASASDIWKLWTDVAGSPEWDLDVAWSRLHGPFQIGTRGEFKLKGGPRFSFVLDQVAKERNYSNVVRILGLSVRFTHALEEISATELRITHGVEFSGPIGWLLRPVARKLLSAALKTALKNMVNLAESLAQRTNIAQH